MRATFIELHGFNTFQVNTFNAALSLAKGKLNHSWCVATTDNVADFFVTADAVNSKKLVLRRNESVKHCSFCKAKECPKACANKNDIVISENNSSLPFLIDLTQTLNQVVNTADQIASSSDSTFDAEHSILKALQDRKEPMLLSIKSTTAEIEIYIDALKGVYFCQDDLNMLVEFFNAANEMTLTKLSIQQLLEGMVKQAELSAKPLSDLIWCMTFHLSEGRLLKDHSNQDDVHLRNWPNLAIPSCKKYIRLAAFMLGNEASLIYFSEKTATPLAEVYNFYNACQLIGLVEKTNRLD